VNFQHREEAEEGLRESFAPAISCVRPCQQRTLC
jgi:hypothetical protein